MKVLWGWRVLRGRDDGGFKGEALCLFFFHFSAHRILCLEMKRSVQNPSRVSSVYESDILGSFNLLRRLWIALQPYCVSHKDEGNSWDSVRTSEGNKALPPLFLAEIPTSQICVKWWTNRHRLYSCEPWRSDQINVDSDRVQFFLQWSLFRFLASFSPQRLGFKVRI